MSISRRGFLKGLTATGIITAAPAIVDSKQLFRPSGKLWTPIKDVETVTKLIDNGDGTFSYISEDGRRTTIVPPAHDPSYFRHVMGDQQITIGLMRWG